MCRWRFISARLFGRVLFFLVLRLNAQSKCIAIFSASNDGRRKRNKNPCSGAGPLDHAMYVIIV